MQGDGLEAIVAAYRREIGCLNVAGSRILQAQPFDRPTGLGNPGSKAKPIEGLHGVGGHPNARPDFAEPVGPLDELEAVTALLESDGQGKTANACSLNQNV